MYPNEEPLENRREVQQKFGLFAEEKAEESVQAQTESRTPKDVSRDVVERLTEAIEDPSYKRLVVTELRKATVWVPLLLLSGASLLWARAKFSR